ncbi:hypothetical protein [Micromonospora globbae]
MADEEHQLLAVDLFDEPGRSSGCHLAGSAMSPPIRASGTGASPISQDGGVSHGSPLNDPGESLSVWDQGTPHSDPGRHPRRREVSGVPGRGGLSG